jgi:YD repeat-containing protein
MLTIVSPPAGDFSHWAFGQKVPCQATSDDPCSDPTTFMWGDNNAGGTFNPPTGANSVYTPPPNITGHDAQGNPTDSLIGISCTDPLSLCPHKMPVRTDVTIVITSDPKRNCNCNCSCPNDQVSEKDGGEEDCGCDCGGEPGGMATPKSQCEWIPCDEENRSDYCLSHCSDDDSYADSGGTGTDCACCCEDNGDGTPTDSSSPPSGDDVNSDDEDCPYSNDADASRISRSLYGRMRVKNGCGMLPIRGQREVDFGVYFTSGPQMLVAAEQLAGPKRSFAWQMRLIRDTVGNIAIYWGDGSTEAWISSDGGLTYPTPPPGRFGTLTRQSDGSFTRTMKNVLYYDFDSTGHLQRIHDRSQDGNFVYYNYDTTPKLVSISGPGMGMTAYFTYDSSNISVTKLTLQAPNAAQNRVTYYNYQAGVSPQPMASIIGPSGCVTYFAYDANQNLTRETNADNYTTYFAYTTETIPRLKQVDLPENQHLIYDYNDNVLLPQGGPLMSRQQVGGRTDYFQYPKGIKSSKNTSIPGALFAYFEYDENAKGTISTAPDGTQTYYEWDPSGQLTSIHFSDGSTNYFTYSYAGRKTSRKNGLGAVTYYNYNANGYQSNWIDTLGNTTVNVGRTPPLNHRHPDPLRNVCCAEVNNDDVQTKAGVGARRPNGGRKVLDPHPGRVEEERTGPPRILPPAPAPRIRILALEAGDPGA